MPLSEEVLNKLISPNARALSSPKGDKFIDEGPIGKGDDFDDSMFLAETYDGPMDVPSNGGYLAEDTAAKARALTDYSSNDFNPNRVRSTKMNSAILEDMVKHPIDTTVLNSQMLESAGGGNPMNADRLSQMVARAKQVDARASELDGKGMPKRQVTESISHGGGGIDYALIKTIINEAVEAKLNDVGTLKAIALTAGKIKLVDNKGNVFTAKLEFQGNIKDKNKGDR